MEVEYFDKHLGQILAHLEELGELDNTLIIATSDNAMPFPRYKGHPHEFATRIPFVAAWPGKIAKPGREANQFASFIDLAPTFLEVAGISAKKTKMIDVEGKSLMDFFDNKVADRSIVITGRERNDMARPNGWGYPVRSLHKYNFVYMHNFKPERWPVGPREGGYKDTDNSPTMSELIYNQRGSEAYQISFGKRPQEELYDISKDPECINNLADKPEFQKLKAKMKQELFARLAEQKDPRMLGNGDVFDQYESHRHNEYDENVERMKQILKRKGIKD